MFVSHSEICEVGLVRNVNQDSILVKSNTELDRHLFVVSDGMGGHSDGEYASGAIVSKLEQFWNDTIMDKNVSYVDIIKQIQQVIIQTSAEIYAKYEGKGICGATCILLYIHEGAYGIISAGDSRIYKKKGLSVSSVMRDDVWENQNFVRGVLTASEIRSNPNRGKLVNAVGCLENVSLNVKTDILKDKDAFILCSDGLYKYCSAKVLAKGIRQINRSNIEGIVDKLKKNVYENGAKDNISIIAVKVFDKEI